MKTLGYESNGPIDTYLISRDDFDDLYDLSSHITERMIRNGKIGFLGNEEELEFVESLFGRSVNLDAVDYIYFKPVKESVSEEQAKKLKGKLEE